VNLERSSAAFRETAIYLRLSLTIWYGHAVPRSLERRSALAALLVVLAAAGCASPAATETNGAAPAFRVVAAENFWGSIAKQLAGPGVAVTSIIVNPSTDPHDYSPTAADARAMAGADVAIVNGIGYDTWASQLIDANPVSDRAVIDVGDVLGLSDGDNPHQWYNPASVETVIDAISAAYRTLDPPHAAYYTAQKRRFETVSLREYNALRAEIRRRFAGVPVGYSESIFEPLGADLRLRLGTPPSFAKSVTEGTEISAKDKQTVDRQAQQHLIKVWLFNSQNVTPDIQRINATCSQQHIPIATVTETLSPASSNFEQWQVAQLRRLLAALHRGTGR
jgi:zinc/manganese transport system substrate-binding protein